MRQILQARVFKPVFQARVFRPVFARLCRTSHEVVAMCGIILCGKISQFCRVMVQTAPISWATMQHVASGSGSFSRISSAPQPHGDLEPDFIPHGVNPSGKRQQRVVSVSSRPFFCRSAVRQYAGNNHQSAKRLYHIPCKIRSAPRYGGNRFIAAKSKRHGARRWPGALAKA
jgi:hypothetical protein